METETRVEFKIGEKTYFTLEDPNLTCKQYLQRCIDNPLGKDKIICFNKWTAAKLLIQDIQKEIKNEQNNIS